MVSLPAQPAIPADLARAVAEDQARFRHGLPDDLHAHLLERYQLEIESVYAGRRIKNPFGKASGQLSLNVRQVERDAEAGLGFCVLKTVIAQDESGEQAMAEWAIHETHMRVEEIVGPRTGQTGWTVTWKGRGWWGTFESYLELFRDSLALERQSGMVIAPSVKYHLPTPDEPGFKEAEYRWTTAQLLDVWAAHEDSPMPLEKDFSPTLAGSDKSRQEEQILTWLRQVPALIKTGVDRPVFLGLKVMNAMFADEFQLAMLRAAIDEAEPAPDFLIYANRLFDPGKEFEGKVGVAYGGPDLSERNLAILERLQTAELTRGIPPLSATGNILSGKDAVAYGLRGATSFQMHTLFQLPDSQFDSDIKNKTEKVLHHLYFDPATGLVPWLVHLREAHGCADARGVTHVIDLPTYGRALI